MKYKALFLLILISNLCFAQKEAITTLSTLIYDNEVHLVQKNKRTHSFMVPLEISPDFWNQFERIDAVFLSAWTGSGEIAKEQYNKDVAKILKFYNASPVIYYAEKSPGFFSFPRKQAGFGTEIAILEHDADSICIRKYNKGKIAPKGVYKCLISRNFGTTPVNFFWRNAIPKQYYKEGTCPGFQLLLRTSSKADTVVIDTKIVLTVMGKRFSTAKTVSMEKFLKEAILNGMKEDGFPLNHARWISENESVFFVTKCPICMPVHNAISEYVRTFKESELKISMDMLDPLVLGKVDEKQKAFSSIINRYVDRHFETCGMNEREVTDMRTKLEEARKVGMSRKSKSFGPFCPSCDGACRIKN